MFSTLCLHSVYDNFFDYSLAVYLIFVSFDLVPNSFELEITSGICCASKRWYTHFSLWKIQICCMSVFRACKMVLQVWGGGGCGNPKFSRSVLPLHFNSCTSFSAALSCNMLKHAIETFSYPYPLFLCLRMHTVTVCQEPW